MQAEFMEELGEGADRLEIPWADPANPANRYVDLRQQPELITELPEARAHPELAGFLRSVNAPESCFATAKCDTWTTAEFSEAEHTAFPAAQTKFAGYVDLVFADERFNFDTEHDRQFGRRLSDLLRAATAGARAELCLRRCYFNRQEAWGFYLTIFLYGYGEDEPRARRAWAAGLAALGGALAKLSGALRQALGERGATSAG